MQDTTQALGRIPYSQQLIPPGNYTGVIKELQEALPNNSIEIFHRPPNGAGLPRISLRFPSIELPSGFAATVYPRHVYKSNTTFGDPGHLWVSSLFLSGGPVISSGYYHSNDPEENKSNINALMQKYEPANVALQRIDLEGQSILDDSKVKGLIDILSSAGFNGVRLSPPYVTTQYPDWSTPQITDAGFNLSKEGTVSGTEIPHKVDLSLSYMSHKDSIDDGDISNRLHISISSYPSIHSLTELDEQIIRMAMALHESDLMTLEEICALFKT